MDLPEKLAALWEAERCARLAKNAIDGAWGELKDRQADPGAYGLIAASGKRLEEVIAKIRKAAYRLQKGKSPRTTPWHEEPHQEAKGGAK